MSFHFFKLQFFHFPDLAGKVFLGTSWAPLWELVSQADGQLLLLDVQTLALLAGDQNNGYCSR